MFVCDCTAVAGKTVIQYNRKSEVWKLDKTKLLFLACLQIVITTATDIC